MSNRSASFRSALLLAGAVALIGLGSLGSAARAEDSSMKQCADKWQAAKAANATGGLSYLQFSSKCRAELKGAPAAATTAPAAPAAAAPAAPAAPAAVAPAKPAMPTTAAPKPAMPAAPAAAGSAVLPNAINPAYSNLKPGDARRKTCSEQYEANKANGGNAGLKWTQKGGGYYSICNAKLKG
jgi:pyruvate/2-oxoglutarate dehydrogenase complex dihydrolipoamide acyltransferase (E2) component